MELPHTSIVCIVRSFVVWSFTLKVVEVLFTCLAEKISGL